MQYVASYQDKEEFDDFKFKGTGGYVTESWERDQFFTQLTTKLIKSMGIENKRGSDRSIPIKIESIVLERGQPKRTYIKIINCLPPIKEEKSTPSSMSK